MSRIAGRGRNRTHSRRWTPSGCAAVAQDFTDEAVGPLGPLLDTGESWVFSPGVTGQLADFPPIVMRPEGGGLPSLGAPFPTCCPDGDPLKYTATVQRGTGGSAVIGAGANPIPIGAPATGWVFAADGTTITILDWDLATVHGTFPYVWADDAFHDVVVNWAGTVVKVYIDAVLGGTITVPTTPTANLLGWVIIGGTGLQDISLSCGDAI